MGVAPGAGQQGPVSAGLSWGMAHGCHRLVRALHDCFTNSEIHAVFTLGDTVAYWPEISVTKTKGQGRILCPVCQVRGRLQRTIVHMYVFDNMCGYR